MDDQAEYYQSMLGLSCQITCSFLSQKNASLRPRGQAPLDPPAPQRGSFAAQE